MIEHPLPLPGGRRLAPPIGRWLASFAAKRVGRRLEREIREYRQRPELRLGYAGPATRRVFRSLIQVNFDPRHR